MIRKSRPGHPHFPINLTVLHVSKNPIKQKSRTSPHKTPPQRCRKRTSAEQDISAGKSCSRVLFKIAAQDKSRIFRLVQNYRTSSEQVTSAAFCPVQCGPVQDRQRLRTSHPFNTAARLISYSHKPLVQLIAQNCDKKSHKSPEIQRTRSHKELFLQAIR